MSSIDNEEDVWMQATICVVLSSFLSFFNSIVYLHIVDFVVHSQCIISQIYSLHVSMSL